jgi:hypothetical protein
MGGRFGDLHSLEAVSSNCLITWIMTKKKKKSTQTVGLADSARAGGKVIAFSQVRGGMDIE